MISANILITGGAGFIGSHLAKHLYYNSHGNSKIIIIDKIDYCSSLNNLKDFSSGNPNFKCIKGDLQSLKFVSDILAEYSIDLIFHLAASTFVDHSFENSVQFTVDNVLGTHVLLEATRKYGRVKRFIHVSTDEVYGSISKSDTNATVCITSSEDSPLDPTNPYACTKACAEIIVKSYLNTYSMPIIITRSSNVYGPCQYPEKIIPKFILRLMSGKSCTIHGDGSHRRRYIHVSDVIEAFSLIAQKGTIGQVYNIGSEFEISNMELARTLIREFNLSEKEHIEYVQDRLVNDYGYRIDSSKLKNELGWKEKINFKDGLYQTIEWYRQNGNNWWEKISCID